MIISICVLAWNEETNLPLTIDNIIDAAASVNGVELDIVVVDDGSTDGTAGVCDLYEKKYNFIRSIHHKQNKGIAAGVKGSLELARGEKFLILPGDNDISQDLIVGLFSASRTADVSMCYFVNKEMRGRGRNTLSAIFNLIYMCTFNVFVQYITGPAVYPVALLRSFTLHSRRISIPVELTVKSLLSGCSYQEIAGFMRQGKAGSRAFSLRNLFETIRTYLMLVWEIKFRGSVFKNTPKRIES